MVITNKWWPIGLFIASIVLYAIGGGLVGSCYYTDGYYVYTNYGMWAGGVALLSIGSILFTAGVVVLILFLLQRHRTVNSARQMENGNVAAPGTGMVTFAQAEQQQQAQALAQKPEATVTSVPVSAPATAPTAPVAGQKFCTTCGTPAQGKFCQGCGTAIQQ